MTNKPMLSVERELLAVVEGFITSQADAFPLINVPRGLRSEGLDQVSKELRALLDKPVTESEVERLERRCKNAELALKVQTENYEALKAAQHQRDPLAYMCRNIRHTLPSMRTQWEPISVAYAQARMHNKALAAEGKADESLLGDEFIPLYAEQPAPVAVVMPERMIDTWNGNRDYLTYDKGWNDALAEVARLNGVKP